MTALARSFALFSGASAVGTITQILKGKLTAIVLGTSGVGILNQLTSFWSLLSVVASLGFYNGMVRHLTGHWTAGESARFREHLSSSLVFLLGLALVGSALGCVYSRWVSAFLFDDEGARATLVCLILSSVPVFVAGQVYRAVLNATRAVSAMVRARMLADIGSVFVLALLIWPFGLQGAIMAYIGLHILYLGLTVLLANRLLGADNINPGLRFFRWQEVQRNTGFGLTGLMASAAGILATIIISRWIIADIGSEANGIYTTALKVATVYLGGLAAAAGGHYFPTIVAARTNLEMHGHMNETLSLYLFVIPPVIVVLMAFGDLLMRLLFSAEFIPAAALLLLILPADLFRITSETIGLSLTAKKRLLISLTAYLFWAFLYIALSRALLPTHGLQGIALAYLIAHVINAIVVLLIVRLLFGFRLSVRSWCAFGNALALVAGTSAIVAFLQFGVARIMACLLLSLLWLLVSQGNPEFRILQAKVIQKVRLQLNRLQ